MNPLPLSTYEKDSSEFITLVPPLKCINPSFHPCITVVKSIQELIRESKRVLSNKKPV